MADSFSSFPDFDEIGESLCGGLSGSEAPLLLGEMRLESQQEIE